MVRLSFWRKLHLMLWKNWNVQLHHWRHAIFCLCIAFLFAVLLIVLRCLVKIDRLEVKRFEFDNLSANWLKMLDAYARRNSKLQEYGIFKPRIAVAYAPNTTDYVNAIMEKANTDDLNKVMLIGYATTSELQAAMISEHYMIGVKFDVKKKAKIDWEKEVENIYPNSLTFSLLLPSEQRIFKSADRIGSNWRTYQLYDSHTEKEPLNYMYENYFLEGFATIQNAISKAYITLRVPNIEYPAINPQRFPRMLRIEDTLVQNRSANVIFLLIFGFLYPCLFITLYFNKEKEFQIIQFLQVMGISYTVQIVAWFINSFVVLFITALFFIAALKFSWNNGFSILNNSSWLAVLLLMTVYIVASISFAFMVSAMFVQRSTAALMLILLWFFTYMPIHVVPIDHSLALQIMGCIFSNCCMAIALNQILKFESQGEGFQWSSYFDKTTIDSHLTNGVLTIFLVLLSILYTSIALCILYWRAGLLETPKLIRKTACFQASRRFFKKWSAAGRRASSTVSTKRITSNYQVNSAHKKVYVEIKGLQKIYKDTIAVKNFNLNLVTGEIVVVMGQNGSGKSTLLSMVTGMIKPTQGTVIIDGVSARQYFESSAGNLGYSPQSSLLIPELNVHNQLIFHCELKGLTGKYLQQEVKKYLLVLNMMDNRNLNTETLSIGLKRYLSVCCALCAQSNLVILDEPDTGMDLLVRRKLRDLLLREKRERTILMTTHSTEEADRIADRIAIMSHGDLKCYGTSSFLRKFYTNGYRLVCIKRDRCVTEVVTAAIQKFLPGRLAPESDIGTELSYRLDQKYLEVFPDILDYLEENLIELKIVSVFIGEASTDEVFLSMGTDNPFGADQARLTNVFNGVSSGSHDEENFRFLHKTKNYKGFQLLISQWRALLLKRFLFNFRVRPIVFLQLVMPVIFTALSFPISSHREVKRDLPTMTYRLNQYPETVTVLDTREKVPAEFEKLIIYRYKQYIDSMGAAHKFIDTKDPGFHEFMHHHGEQKLKKTSDYKKYVIGATFIKDSVTAFYNDVPLHSVPLSINMINNAILRAATNDSNAFITVTFEPLPFRSHLANDLYNDVGVGGVMAINLTFYFGLVWSIIIMSLVKERHNNFKMIQYIHGARPSSYWLTMFVYDFVLIIAVSIVIIIVMLCFQYNVFMQYKIPLFYFFTLVVFGTFMLPFNFVLSYLFDDPMTAFCVVTVINFYSGVTFSTFMNALDGNYLSSEKLAQTIQWIMRIVPPFALCNTLAKVLSFAKLKLVCSDPTFKEMDSIIMSIRKNTGPVHISSYKCKMKPYCCVAKKIWSWSDGFFPELLAIVTVGVCSTIVLIIIELYSVHKAGIFNKVIPKDNVKAAKEDYNNWHDENRLRDESREMERIRVLTLEPRDYVEKALIMKGVGRIHKHICDFHRIFLVLNHYECFGLFGSSVSGKSAFLRMLIQNNASSYGDIFVNGLSLRHNLYEVYDRISYCPQRTSNVNEFSGFELMKIICMLHGIPRSEIVPICEGLARAFGFMPQLRKLIKFYSPGTKRRMRTSLAMLGNPSIIYLDEPMLGIDLVSLRQLCHILCEVRKSGTSVLFTSLSQNLTEVFCSRIAFLANGRLSHIGAAQDIKEYSYEGYLVKIKLQNTGMGFSGIQLGSTESMFLFNPFLKIQSFVEMTFHNAVMKDQRGNIMYFVIPSKNVKMSEIFQILHKNLNTLAIETFTVSHDTLSLFIYETIERTSPLRNFSQIHLH